MACRRTLIPRLLAGAAILIVLFAATTGAVDATATSAATSAFCSNPSFAAADTFVWTGADATNPDSWQEAANWIVQGAPATRAPGDPYDVNGPGDLDDPSRATDYVCISTGPTGHPASVVLGGKYYAGAGIAALDLAGGARLTVTGNSRLWLSSRKFRSQPSIVRSGSTLLLRGATLGGAGALEIAGVLDARTSTKYPVTVTTRWCDVGAGCQPAVPPTQAGRIDVITGGRFVIDGNPKGGVNLEDSRIVSNRGQIVFENAGYLAADRGTAITNASHGTVVLRNDGGIYEGRARYGLPLPTLANAGEIRKSAGDRTSVFGTAYSSTSSASLVIDSGSVSIDGASAPAALVKPGSSYGTGGCVPKRTSPNGCHEALPTAPGQSTRVLLPTGFSGRARVAVAQQKATGAPAGVRGRAVYVDESHAQSTAARPQKLTLSYTVKTFGQKTLKGVVVYRAPVHGKYRRISTCQSDGQAPRGGSACVDLRKGASHVKDGNVVIVVRSRYTHDSRWVVV